MLNLTADEQAVQRESRSIGQVFPLLTVGCWFVGAGALSPCLLQRPQYWDVERFGGCLHSGTHLSDVGMVVPVCFSSSSVGLSSWFPVPQSSSVLRQCFHLFTDLSITLFVPIFIMEILQMDPIFLVKPFVKF